MSLECSSNLVSFACGTFFRTCAEVTDASGDSAWAPALTCESDCEAFSTVWNKCMGDLETDAEAKQRFDDAMVKLVRLRHWHFFEHMHCEDNYSPLVREPNNTRQ
jgi:hypothetical protein